MLNNLASLPNVTRFQTVTLNNSGNTTSETVQTLGLLLVGIVIGGTWDTANITFTESTDNTNFYAKYDDSGNLYTVTAAASHVLTVPAAKLVGMTGFLKVVATAAQNTSSPRQIVLVLRAI